MPLILHFYSQTCITQYRSENVKCRETFSQEQCVQQQWSLRLVSLDKNNKFTGWCGDTEWIVPSGNGLFCLKICLAARWITDGRKMSEIMRKIDSAEMNGLIFGLIYLEQTSLRTLSLLNKHTHILTLYKENRDLCAQQRLHNKGNTRLCPNNDMSIVAFIKIYRLRRESLN